MPSDRITLRMLAAQSVRGALCLGGPALFVTLIGFLTGAAP